MIEYEPLSAEYDLKDDLFRLNHYRKLLEENPEDTVLREHVRRLSAANAYLIGICAMDPSLSLAMEKICTVGPSLSLIMGKATSVDYKNIRKYLIFRIQGTALDWRNWSYDCDRSLEVRMFYHALGYEEKHEYYDTYFSVQTFWGKFIEKFYGKQYRNDFVWQLKEFDNIILQQIENSEMKTELEKLMQAFDNLTHDYHTIGNIAPCAPRINEPKGSINNHAYDRIDLFLEKLKDGSLKNISESNKQDWLKWYDESKKGNNVEMYELGAFVKETELSPEPLPPDKKTTWDQQDIGHLANYLNDVSKLIKGRGEKII